MEFLVEYGAFLLKAITIVVSILIVVGGIISLSARPKSQADGELVIKKLNDELEDHKEQLEDAILDKELLKKMAKDKKKDDKQKEKSAKKAAKTKTEDEPEEKKRVFVLDFDGDIKASEVELLRHEISAILTMASPKDEVVVTLESGGGMVHSYGLASSQLQRIRDKNIPLTVCVDKVAASGGYMMACLADKVVAAPFAIIGSIGVVAQLPNFNRLLKKHDVDFELFTAGEYKRTVTMFGHNSAKAKEKFQSDLEDTHELFKDHVALYRKDLNVEAVATGDIWYGQQALENGLIDEVGTSDQYLMNACDESDVFTVRYEYKKTLQEKLGIAVQQGAESAFTRLLTAANNRMQSKG